MFPFVFLNCNCVCVCIGILEMDTGMNVNVFVQCVNQKEKHDIFAKFDIMTFAHTPITRPGTA